jgi:hypothetical protein
MVVLARALFDFLRDLLRDLPDFSTKLYAGFPARKV